MSKPPCQHAMMLKIQIYIRLNKKIQYPNAHGQKFHPIGTLSSWNVLQYIRLEQRFLYPTPADKIYWVVVYVAG